MFLLLLKTTPSLDCKGQAPAYVEVDGKDVAASWREILQQSSDVNNTAGDFEEHLLANLRPFF